MVSVVSLLISQTVYAELNVSGVDASLEANVRALSPLSTTRCDVSRWRLERLYSDVEDSVANAVRALGYYHSTVSKSLRWDESCWHIDIVIDAGDPVLVRDVAVDITGAAVDDDVFIEQAQIGQPRRDMVLNHGLYSDYKTTLQRAAISSGYFDAELTQSGISVDRDARAADVTMHLDSGEKYRFGDVSFTPGILRDYILQGYTDIESGSPYQAKSISDLYEALNGSSYFASVSIKTDPLDTDAKLVPINVELKPARRRIYSIGAGFTTDGGPHGRIGYSDRRINDKGHQFESKLFASEVTRELNATYRWPKRDPRREWFSIVAGVQHENTETSEQDSFKLGFLRSKSLGKSWLQTRYVDYAYEDFTVADQSSTSELIILGTNWETIRGRALSRATSGYRFSLDLRGASDALGSDTSFLQLRSKAKWVHSLGDKTRLLARASLGLTSKDDLAELPASVRFFAGGDSSVRGYDFETLGPIDSSGAVIGGSHQFDVSLEIDRLFKTSWAIAAFVDAGDAFNATDIKLKTGIGLGLRWYSPVGPIRLDVAHPLDNPDEDIRIHISLGPDL